MNATLACNIWIEQKYRKFIVSNHELSNEWNENKIFRNTEKIIISH